VKGIQYFLGQVKTAIIIAALLVVSGCATAPEPRPCVCPEVVKPVCPPCEPCRCPPCRCPEEQQLSDARESAAESGQCKPDQLREFLAVDGTLTLRGSQTLVLGRGPHVVDSICVEGQGSIRVCDETTIRIVGTRLAIIAGRGIGSHGSQPVSIVLEAPNRAPLYVLVENQVAPAELVIDSPGGSAMVSITGKAGLTLNPPPSGSKLGRLTTNSGWGDISRFPGCGGKLSKAEQTLIEIRKPCEAKQLPFRPTPPPQLLQEPTGRNKKVFDHRREAHRFVVPGGVNSITVEAWGAGGGGGSANKAQARGGGGAFARATVAVMPGEELQVYVGGGGQGGPRPGFGKLAGGGGGASYLARGKTVLLVAAGGGGAGADGCSGCKSGRTGNGGPGGGLIGYPGDAVGCHTRDRDCAAGGVGGSQVRGGQGGVGPHGKGDDGGKLTGGGSHGWTGKVGGGKGNLGGTSKAANGSGGGGGSGWYGGGGGGMRKTYCGGGGGGGSSYSSPENLRTLLIAGEGWEPGHTSDEHYAWPAGQGGEAGKSGQPGRLVIIY
jgi:hypothetical protein